MLTLGGHSPPSQHSVDDDPMPWPSRTCRDALLVHLCREPIKPQTPERVALAVRAVRGMVMGNERHETSLLVTTCFAHPPTGSGKFAKQVKLPAYFAADKSSFR
jgi:hypothetical protein